MLSLVLWCTFSQCVGSEVCSERCEVCTDLRFDAVVRGQSGDECGVGRVPIGAPLILDPVFNLKVGKVKSLHF